MKRSKEFPFHNARRITPTELESFRKGIEKAEGKKRLKRLGRPAKTPAEKYIPVSIRLHPQVLSWLKKEAKKRAVPYQTIINQLLLKETA
jgi:predicted DNA binding CopG/RHH family protein